MTSKILAVGLALICAGLAFGQDRDHDRDAKADLSKLPPILRRVILSAEGARYSGERIVQFKRGADVDRHTEEVWKDGRRSRVEFPDDSPYHGQIIVDDGQERRHYYPDRNEIRMEPSHGSEAGRHLQASILRGLRRKFTNTESEGGKVAGLSTRLVTVADASGNTAQQLWVEPRSGVVLKRVLFDQVGAQIGYFEFRNVNFRPIFTPGTFTIDRKGATVITPAAEARRYALQLGLTPVVLPESSGFKLQFARIITPQGRNVLLQSFIGSEGRFTLFQMRGAVDPNRLQRMGRERISTYSWTRGEESFALVGELSRDRLQQIAKFLGDN